MSASSAASRVITGFSFKRIRRGAIILGIVFGVAVFSQTVGLVQTYPDTIARGQLINSLKDNIGLRIMFGSSEHLTNTISSYVTWRVLGILTVIGSIWALLSTTRLLRGEEESGRWELLTSGPTTVRGVTRQTLLGLVLGLLLIMLIGGTCLALSGQMPGVEIGVGASFAYGASMIAGALMFVSVAAVTSQLASTRQQAAMMASGFLGVCFLLRALANTVHEAHWLRVVNPLCWVDNILPLTNQRFIWFVPIVLFSVAVGSLALFLSGRRDVEASLLPQKDSARAHLRMLHSPLAFAIRSLRGSAISWLLALSVPSLLFGALAVTAANILETSDSLTNGIGKVLGEHSTDFGVKIYLGMAFLIITIVMMVLATSIVQGIRREESQETLDALLVRPVSRLQWLAGRISIAVVWITVAGLWTGVVCWLAAVTQHATVPFSTFLSAGANTLAPAFCMLGIGIATFGFKPRLTGTVTYGIISWSFLLEILGSLLNLPSWVQNTSILHHLAAVPAVEARWGSAYIMSVIGLILMILGAIAFTRRDLQNE